MAKRKRKAEDGSRRRRKARRRSPPAHVLPIAGLSACSDPIDLAGLGDVEVEVAVDSLLESGTAIEVQESADGVNWVSRPGLAGTWGTATTVLPPDPARRFLRLRIDGLAPGVGPRTLRCRVRPRRPRGRRSRRDRRGRSGGA